MVFKHSKGPGAAGNLLFLKILIVNQILLNIVVYIHVPLPDWRNTQDGRIKQVKETLGKRVVVSHLRQVLQGGGNETDVVVFQQCDVIRQL